MFWFSKSKKSKEKKDKPVVSYNGAQGKTEYFEDSESGCGISGTQPGVAKYTIKLSDLKNTSRTWTVQVTGDLLIGRGDDCAIQFFDLSVSREQCKITVKNGELVIEQIGSTNKTKQNGIQISECSRLHSGDILRFGREGLRVDYIQTLNGTVEQPVHQLDDESDFDEDHTVSFF